MCGRFLATSPPSELAGLLGVDEVRVELAPSWNVAPTDQVAAVSQAGDGRRLLGAFRWGLVPSWAPGPGVGSRMINARAETLESRFRRTFERRRCLVPADGFYEWERRADGSRRPWLIRRADGAPMVFAGLWEVWRDPADPDGAEPLRTCSIVTTEANDLLRPVHGRMPALLDPGGWDRWLDRTCADTASLRTLLAPADPRALEMFEVSTRVNSVRNNDPALAEPV